MVMGARIVRGALMLIGVAVLVGSGAWGFMHAIDERVRIQQEVWHG